MFETLTVKVTLISVTACIFLLTLILVLTKSERFRLSTYKITLSDGRIIYSRKYKIITSRMTRINNKEIEKICLKFVEIKPGHTVTAEKITITNQKTDEVVFIENENDIFNSIKKNAVRQNSEWT